MLKRYLILLSLLATPLLFIPSHASAVDVFKQNVCERGRASGATVCKEKDIGGSNPLTGTEGVLTNIINLLSIITGIVALIIIMLAGLKFITSSTNPQDVTNARERVIYACVALVIAAMAQVAVRFIIGKVNL
jgi:hypothetical protein